MNLFDSLKYKIFKKYEGLIDSALSITSSDNNSKSEENEEISNWLSSFK